MYKIKLKTKRKKGCRYTKGNERAAITAKGGHRETKLAGAWIFGPSDSRT